MNLEKTLATMVERLVTRFDPTEIFLFGSRARDTAHAGSDIDLLVILPVVGSLRAKRVEMRVALHDLHVPTDIVVATPTQVHEQRHVVGTLIRTALAEGKLLYARNGSGSARNTAMGAENRKRLDERRAHPEIGKTRPNGHRLLSRPTMRRKISQGAPRRARN